MRPVWATEQVPGKTRMLDKTLYQKRKEEREKEGKGRERKENPKVENLCQGALSCYSAGVRLIRRVDLCVPQEVCTICSNSWPFLVLSGKESFLMIENSKSVVVQCPPCE